MQFLPYANMKSLDGWKFTTSASGTWEWAYEESPCLPRRSARSFRTLLECLADASAHGYERNAADDPADRDHGGQRAQQA